MNNLATMRNCLGVQSRLNWMLGYNFKYVNQLNVTLPTAPFV